MKIIFFICVFLAICVLISIVFLYVKSRICDKTNKKNTQIIDKDFEEKKQENYEKFKKNADSVTDIIRDIRDD